MKKLLSFLFGIILLSSCQDESNLSQTKISINTPNDSLVISELYRPANGLALWTNRVDTIPRIQSDLAEATIDIEAPEYVRFKIGTTRKRMILLPNQNYSIEYTGEGIKFSDNNADGQALLNDFDRTPTAAFNFINRFNGDTSAIMISNSIMKLKQAELDQIDELLSLKKIDDQFYKMLKLDVDYYYADGLAFLASYKSEKTNENAKKEFKTLYAEVLNEYPIEIENKPMNWFDYIMNTTITTEMSERYSQDERNRFYKNDSLHLAYYGVINEIINDPYREVVLAGYIISAAKQDQYEKSLVQVFNDFNDSFADNVFSEYLVSDITPIVDYHEKIKGELSQNVTIIEEPTINSLTELLESLPGQKLYIDVWATWCGPCKREFANNHMIEDLLEEKGYKKLYISIDNESAKDKWLELIKYYDLAGYHHLANRAFFLDFEKNHSAAEGMVYIPQYLIVNEYGEIVTNNAPRPGLPGKLEKLL